MTGDVLGEIVGATTFKKLAKKKSFRDFNL